MTNDSLLIHKLGRIEKFDSSQMDISLCEFSSLNSSCGDKISIFMDVSNGLVENISIIHVGCILSKAATNALLLSIENKTKEFAINLIDQFIRFFACTNISLNAAKKYKLTPELILFEKFIVYPSRKDCVLMPAKIIKGILCKPIPLDTK